MVVGMSGEAGSFLTTILGAGPRDLRDEGRLDMASGYMTSLGGDSEVEVGEEAEGTRQEEEEEDLWERLKDVRKRRALALGSMLGAICGGGR